MALPQTITVYGTGCKKCAALHAAAQEAARAMEPAPQVLYITDILDIAAAGVLTTPALAFDGTVVASGRVLSAAQIEALT